MARGKNMWATDSSKLQGYLNFAFDQREIEVNLHTFDLFFSQSCDKKS
jgi:hypothetical protein